MLVIVIVAVCLCRWCYDAEPMGARASSLYIRICSNCFSENPVQGSEHRGEATKDHAEGCGYLYMTREDDGKTKLNNELK